MPGLIQLKRHKGRLGQMPKVSSLPVNPFDSSYCSAVGGLPGADVAGIDGLRQNSRVICNSQGLPSSKQEDWKYSSLRNLSRTPFIPASRADDVDVGQVPYTVPFLEDALKLVLVNGEFRPDLSDSLDRLGDGVIVKPLAESLSTTPKKLQGIIGAIADPESSFIAALNTGFMEDGLFILVGPGKEIKRPLHIVSIGASGASPGSFHPRFVVELGKGSGAVIVESHIGLPGQSYLTNVLTEVTVGEAAQLNHYVHVCEDVEAFHLGQSVVSVRDDGRYESFTFSEGARLCRREVKVCLQAENAGAYVNGAYVLTAKQHSDIFSEIVHAAPNTTSNQMIKGVLGGESFGAFQGKIHVARNAQKSDGQQSHKALLLGSGPEVNCKPELEIFADDVKCSHGASTGEIDKNQLFYLASRGICEKEARALLVQGFVNEVILRIVNERVRNYILDIAKLWLARQSSVNNG